MLLSNTSEGAIMIWHAPTQERWGAFAGDFEELDENIMYEEKEDEFDIVSVSWYRECCFLLSRLWSLPFGTKRAATLCNDLLTLVNHAGRRGGNREAQTIARRGRCGHRHGRRGTVLAGA